MINFNIQDIPIGAKIYWKMADKPRRLHWSRTESCKSYFILETIYLGNYRLLVPKGYGYDFESYLTYCNNINKKYFPSCQTHQYDWRRPDPSFEAFYSLSSLWIDFNSDEENV